MAGVALAALAIATVLFVWVAWHEFGYAHRHPYAYGPANVIGVAGIAGAVVAACLWWIVWELRAARA
jgi:hypothetical protein